MNFLPGDGKAVCKFKLAVKREFTKDKSDFINCVSWGKTGETIAQYLTKGRQLAVTGSIRTGSYDAQDGTKRYTTDVIVESFEFIGSNNSNNQGNANSTGAWNPPEDTGFGYEEPIDDGDMPF